MGSLTRSFDRVEFPKSSSDQNEALIINHNKVSIDLLLTIYTLYYSSSQNRAASESRFGNPENSSTYASFGPEKSSAPWKFMKVLNQPPPKKYCFLNN